MGSQRIILLVAFVFIEGYNAAGQCGRVEYISQPAAAAPSFQPISQFVVPAVIKPLVEKLVEKPAESSKPATPDYSHFPYYPPAPYMPPIIYQDDDDDDWKHLLYFLIFAMKNRSNMGSHAPQPIPYAYPVPMDFGYSDRYGCDKSNNVNYIPYPVPISSNCGFADSNMGFGEEITIIPSSVPAQNGRENEVTLLIRTEK